MATVAAACGGSGGTTTAATTTASAPKTASFTAALVSDIGKFTDKGFNQNQLKGLNDAKSKLGITGLALQSNAASDYAPNFNSRDPQGRQARDRRRLPAREHRGDVREEVPEVDFAITDYTVHTSPFADKNGKSCRRTRRTSRA